MQIFFKNEEGVELPKYKTNGAAGMDVVANSILKVYSGKKEITGERLAKMQQTFKDFGKISLRQQERILFGTGLSLEFMSSDQELQIRSQCKLALDRGLVVIQPNAIDSDHVGQVGITLYNSNNYLVELERGENIAQLVANTIVRPTIGQLAADLT